MNNKPKLFDIELKDEEFVSVFASPSFKLPVSFKSKLKTML